jgi:uncharacterized protein with HEPN domain
MQRELAYLLDILQSARLIHEYAEGVDKDDFMHDTARQDAIVRRIEIIGEATRHISADYRADHPEIPWKQMAGMRDKVIHEYDRVDLVEVWKVAERDIPALIKLIEPLVPRDQPDEDS